MPDHVILGAFLTCVLGGILPWVNTEVVVAGAALVVGPPELVALVAATAAGQMVAKTSVYVLARWAPGRLPGKSLRPLSGPVAARIARSRRAAAAALLASAGVGVPPFYLTTLAAGALRVPLVVFVAAGMAGTVLRYAVLAVGSTLVASGADGGLP